MAPRNMSAASATSCSRSSFACFSLRTSVVIQSVRAGDGFGRVTILFRQNGLVDRPGDRAADLAAGAVLGGRLHHGHDRVPRAFVRGKRGEPVVVAGEMVGAVLHLGGAGLAANLV